MRQFVPSLVLLLVVLVAGIQAGTGTGTGTGAEDAQAQEQPQFLDNVVVTTDRTCYEGNDTLSMEVNFDLPLERDTYMDMDTTWVGVYPFDFAPSEEPLWWIYLAHCSTTSTSKTKTKSNGVNQDQNNNNPNVCSISTTATNSANSANSATNHRKVDIQIKISDAAIPPGRYKAVLAQDPPNSTPVNPTHESLDNNPQLEHYRIIQATSPDQDFYVARGRACTLQQQRDLQSGDDDMASVIAAARSDIIQLIDRDITLPGRFLRMVFHDCIGGRCDGCINMRNPDHAGIPVAMNALQPVVERYQRDGLSRADIWALASFVGVEQMMPSSDRISFAFQHYGRRDCGDRMTAGPDPVICSPNMGTNEMLDFFDQEFGFSPREVAAIMGAHTIGVMRREDLGFDAPTGWVLDEHIFNNGFHQALTGRDGDLSKPPNWVQRLVRNSNLPDRWQWVAVPEGELAVMLNSDIALVRQLDSSNRDASGQVSCSFIEETGDGPECPFSRDAIFQPVLEYARNNRQFLRDFYATMVKMVDVGYRVDDTTCDSRGVCGLRPR